MAALVRSPWLARIAALATAILVAACNNGNGGAGY
jgi:predicted small secreted protein